jgi:hypothetical protein
MERNFTWKSRIDGKIHSSEELKAFNFCQGLNEIDLTFLGRTHIILI